MRDAHASTIPSAQGLTFSDGIVLTDIFGHKDRQRGQRPVMPPRQALYVALSRVPAFKGVYLMQKLTREDLDYCRPRQEDLDYAEFIDATAEETRARFFPPMMEETRGSGRGRRGRRQRGEDGSRKRRRG